MFKAGDRVRFTDEAINHVVSRRALELRGTILHIDLEGFAQVARDGHETLPFHVEHLRLVMFYIKERQNRTVNIVGGYATIEDAIQTAVETALLNGYLEANNKKTYGLEQELAIDRRYQDGDVTIWITETP